MYCKKCDANIQKDWSFCPHCGSRIERIKINIDNLYRVNNHKMTRRKCKKYKRKEGEE